MTLTETCLLRSWGPTQATVLLSSSLCLSVPLCVKPQSTHAIVSAQGWHKVLTDACSIPPLRGAGLSCGWVNSLFLPDTASSPQAHNDLLRTYEAKLLAFGIPLDNVGFKPLETAVIGQTLGQGPAGLVGTPT